MNARGPLDELFGDRMRPHRRILADRGPVPASSWRTFAIAALAVAATVACVAFPSCARAAAAVDAGPVSAEKTRYALVTQDAVPLRGGPHGAGAPLAVLGQGTLVELRGARLDYLQVYDLGQERGGFVRASSVRPLSLAPGEAPELLALVRFLRDRPGSESLGLGFAAAYLKAAPAGTITAEVFDAMGTMAERLAARANRAAASAASPSTPGEASVAAQLQVATGLGLRFDSLERDGGVALCYDGDAFRHVFALQPTPEQAARAALALTRPDCQPATLAPLQRWQADQARAAVLSRVPLDALPTYERNRLKLRAAGVWSTIAFEDSRRAIVEGDAASAAATGLPAITANDTLRAGAAALDALAGIDKAELTDDDQAAYADAAMRVGASRWAAEPPLAPPAGLLHVVTQPGQPGETCVLLVDARHDAAHALARRCTFATVWTVSARVNTGSTALALAVQPLATWRELWMFRQTPAGWVVQVLPPSTQAEGGNGVGYVEFAGWVPSTGEVLAAREMRDPAHGGRALRTYELLDSSTLETERSADAPGSLNAFYRWQDPAWKRITVSLR